MPNGASGPGEWKIQGPRETVLCCCFSPLTRDSAIVLMLAVAPTFGEVRLPMSECLAVSGGPEERCLPHNTTPTQLHQGRLGHVCRNSHVGQSSDCHAEAAPDGGWFE